MKTFVIAQHHGAFLTLQSLADCGIDNVIVIIPGTQVEKYNKMYNERPNDPEFKAFKDYDKALGSFAKSLGYKAFLVDSFDIRNTITSTLRIVQDLGYSEIVACLMSGALAIKDYRQPAREALILGQVGMCLTRVYQNNNQLSMYHMIGLERIDNSVDLNFFVADMSKILNIPEGDSSFLSEIKKKKQLVTIDRGFNGKDDVLIGSAISARQTITHNLGIQSGYIVNLWNKAIKNNSVLKSEEIYGYPLNFYSKYVRQVGDYLPRSTVEKIIINGDETEKCTSGLYECLDIIDL